MQMAERIREALEGAGPTAMQLAKACEVPVARLAGWSDGSVEAKPVELFRLEDATGYSARWIATGEGPKRLGQASLPSHVEPHRVTAPIGAKGAVEIVTVTGPQQPFVHRGAAMPSTTVVSGMLERFSVLGSRDGRTETIALKFAAPGAPFDPGCKVALQCALVRGGKPFDSISGQVDLWMLNALARLNAAELDRPVAIGPFEAPQGGQAATLHVMQDGRILAPDYGPKFDFARPEQAAWILERDRERAHGVLDWLLEAIYQELPQMHQPVRMRRRLPRIAG